MKTKNGKSYKTISDASSEIGVSVSTIRRHIRSGVFPPPDRVFFGSQSVAVFDDDYIELARGVVKKMQGSGR